MKKITKLVILFLCCILNATGCNDKKDDSIASGKAGELTWVISEDSILTISGKGDMPNYGNNIMIPEHGIIQPWPSNFTAVVIEDGITSVGAFAFQEHTALKSVKISNTVTKISGYSFIGCSNLTSVTFGYSVERISGRAFERTGLSSVAIPASVKTIGDGAFSSFNLTSFDVDNKNTEYCSEDGVLFNKTQTLLINYPMKKPGETYTFPSTVTEIGSGAFGGVYELTSIIIPNTVAKIEEQTFSHCSSLTSVTIPSSVKEITSNAFNGCSNLKEFINHRIQPQSLIYIFEGVNKEECVLFVPAGSEVVYRKAEGWKEFVNIKAIQ